MSKVISPFIAVAIFALLTVTPAAAEETVVLIVSEESTKDAVSRRNPVFRTALIAVAGQMLKSKITPKGAGEVLAKGSYKAKGRNIMKVWQSAAERAEPPVQFLVGLRLVVSVIERSQSQLVEVRLTAMTNDVSSGKEIGFFETDKPRRYPLPADCDRKCVVKIANGAVKEVAAEAGAASAASILTAR